METCNGPLVRQKPASLLPKPTSALTPAVSGFHFLLLSSRALEHLTTLQHSGFGRLFAPSFGSSRALFEHPLQDFEKSGFASRCMPELRQHLFSLHGVLHREVFLFRNISHKEKAMKYLDGCMMFRMLALMLFFTTASFTQVTVPDPTFGINGSMRSFISGGNSSRDEAFSVEIGRAHV